MTAPQADSVRAVCRLRREHLPGAAELERLCFSSPWSEAALALFLGEGFAFAVPGTDGALLAYGSLLPAPPEGELVNLAVHPSHRRQGLGGAVLDALLAESDRRGLERISLEVRVSNIPAIALYRTRGFAVAGVRRRFYTAPVEDAYVMVRESGGTPSAGAPTAARKTECDA